jgi:hypothetical protein
MNKAISAVCLLSFASTLILAQNSPSSGEAKVQINNILSPFSTIVVVKPYPHPEYLEYFKKCNQGFVEWKPVCAITRNRIAATYSARCFAVLDGATPIADEACPAEKPCSSVYEPVCARVAAYSPDAAEPFEVKPYINGCIAEKADGYEATLRKHGDPLYRQHEQRISRHQDQKIRFAAIEAFDSVCPKTCSDKIELICAQHQSGEARLYKNRCSAILAGADPNKYKSLTPCK